MRHVFCRILLTALAAALFVSETGVAQPPESPSESKPDVGKAPLGRAEPTVAKTVLKPGQANENLLRPDGGKPYEKGFEREGASDVSGDRNRVHNRCYIGAQSARVHQFAGSKTRRITSPAGAHPSVRDRYDVGRRAAGVHEQAVRAS